MTLRLSTKFNGVLLSGLLLALSACAAPPVLTPTSVALQPTATSTLPLPASPTTALPSPTVPPPTAITQPMTPPATPTMPPSAPTAAANPTLVIFVPTPHGDGPCTYQATFLGDMTIPDNTEIAPGASFVKTWRVRNDGTCTWGSNGYALSSLMFYNGDRLGSPNSIGLPGEVPPGSVVDLSVNMIAPQNPGVYRSDWMLSIAGDPYGPRLLGVGAAGSVPLYALIVVPSSSGPQQPQTYTSALYHYAINYPTDWTAQVNTSLPTGGGSSPEYVTFMPDHGGLPRLQIEALTGVSPMTGLENCVPNFVFHNLPACKISLPAGQNPAEDVWVFQKGAIHFYLQLQYQDASSIQVFNDILTSFTFTG